MCDVHLKLRLKTLPSLRKGPIVGVLVETLRSQVTENREFSSMVLKYYLLTFLALGFMTHQRKVEWDSP